MLKFGLLTSPHSAHVSHIRVTVTCNREANLEGTACELFALPKEPLKLRFGQNMHEEAILQ